MLTSILLAVLSLARASQPGDVAYEKTAHRLELVRNQIELTISNHRSLAQDLIKQGRELEGMHVLERVPLATRDARDDGALALELRRELERAAALRTGFRVREVKLRGPWHAARAGVPRALPFDTDYRIPEDQLADSRLFSFVLEFDAAAPREPTRWLRENQDVIHRLLEPVSWKRQGRRLAGTARIYRFRDVEYPEMLAPDLSRYAQPEEPATAVQRAALGRIRRYREEISRLWPRAQPHVDNIRKF
ncbi:MAG: hypothetical protein HY075_05190, partial [Deltaproteobacteria bacterium]|nr:hypothetical protein [Deltaproteobacteria bacterium]